MSDSEPDTDTLEMHDRITLDFRLLVRAITPEVRRESLYFNDQSAWASKPHFQENVERQRRLYTLLRNDRSVMEQYLLSVLVQEAVIFVSNRLVYAFDVKDEEKLLEPLYRSMAEEDAGFFEECRELGVLTENTELIAKAFKVECVGAEVEEMSRRVVGDVRRAEFVEQIKTYLIRKLNTPG